jgi:DNA-binding beta-propeller fold protein YncE
MILSQTQSRTLAWAFPAAVLFACVAGGQAEAAPAFTLFETGQVRPLALSPNKKLLFAINTPDNRLEVFRVKNNGLEHRASVPVGLEPIAVAARSNTEVWVVNHLSDSVSVVKLSAAGHAGTVVRTLLVGDEPRDIVFAGPGNDRAFITTAHRGQNSPIDPQLTTPGVGRADVWAFDAGDLGDSLGGDPLTIVTVFSDTPRALAVSPDGHQVYAAAFHSGNRTTSIFETLVPDGGEEAGGLPEPRTNFQGIPAPEVGLIVKHNGTHWVDELGRSWDDQVRLSLPDKDVFVIDAMANPPVQVSGPAGFFTGVGTVLFNMAVNPASGKVYVSNSEAFNEVRFEGPGTFAGSSVRGHLHESRITVLTPGGGVAPRHLNKHIDFSSCCDPIPNAENEKSLAQPLGMAVTSDGSELYVAALGSSKVGVYSTAALETDTFVPSTANQIPVTGGGPTGLVLDEAKNRLYVLTRFDNSISIIHTTTKAEIAHIAMHNPEPESIVDGRRFLYDASFTSSHGDSSCASCHIFGDFDSLAWDLGNPDATLLPNLNPFPFGLVNVITGEAIIDPQHHPMKGPMVTQSLRGMANHGPMHWRGDRSGANDEPSMQPDSGNFNEDAAFKKFQVGFTGLLGRSEFIPEADMQAFTDFILQVMMPPNPIRALDNSLTPDEAAGRNEFFTRTANGIAPCAGCHPIDPNFNSDAPISGLFGTSGNSSFDFETQLFKMPQLRNHYQKVGKFGMPETPFVFLPGNNDHMGEQVRGFGFVHDGSVDTVFRFVGAVGFSELFFPPEGIPVSPEGEQIRRQLEAFVMAFDSNLAPIVGQQITLTQDNECVAGPRIDLLASRADEGECELVAKARLPHREIGFLYTGFGMFATDVQAAPPISDTLLRHLATDTGRELTYTCAPPGSGTRIGIDRDGDGFLDGDEHLAGSNPADPNSTP